MINKKTMQITRTIYLAGLMLALLAGATAANAQSREGRWDFTIGTPIQLGGTFDFEGGSTVKTNDDWGFALTTGYNLSEISKPASASSGPVSATTPTWSRMTAESPASRAPTTSGACRPT